MMTSRVDGAAILTASGEEDARRLVELAKGSGPQAALADLALTLVFGEVWARDGLTRRDRSIVTLGVLVALRHLLELWNHVSIGLANGLSRREIEEAIVQTVPYPGLSAAWAAANALAEIDMG